MDETQISAMSDEQLTEAIGDERLTKMVLSRDSVVNAVIAGYLDDLSSAPVVPSVRGYCALSVLPKPKTLEAAKKIVDGR